MDVSGWTVDQKMRLPDWCFGNREVQSVYLGNGVVGTFKWAICETVMPDPACIWQAVLVSSLTAGASGYFRVGLADNVPVNEAQMDAAVEIFPYFGVAHAGPNVISDWGQPFVYWGFDVRKGMATGGKKIVLEVKCIAATIRCLIELTVSTLPTNMAGWLAHNKV